MDEHPNHPLTDATSERLQSLTAYNEQLAESLRKSEARGRQYCLELAEKAGKIRELETVHATDMGEFADLHEKLGDLRERLGEQEVDRAKLLERIRGLEAVAPFRDLWMPTPRLLELQRLLTTAVRDAVYSAAIGKD